MNRMMEDDIQKLEAELAELSPAPVPQDLEDRGFAIFEGEVTVQPAEQNVVPFPIWQRIGAAAAVGVASVGVYFAFLTNFGEPPASTSANRDVRPPSVESIAPAEKNFVPASANNTFRGVRDGGVFLNEEGQPVRELRYEFSDSYRWVDEKDGSELELIVPRERSYLVPVPTD